MRSDGNTGLLLAPSSGGALTFNLPSVGGTLITSTTTSDAILRDLELHGTLTMKAMTGPGVLTLNASEEATNTTGSDGDLMYWTAGAPAFATVATVLGGSPWLLGGNALTTATNQLGTTSAHDVQLIAGGTTNVRLTLSNTFAATIVNDGGEIRYEEAGGSNYTAFKAGTQTTDITYTLPTTAPTAGQALRAGNTTPTDLEWSTPGGTGSILVYVKTSDQEHTNSDWEVVSGFSYTLEPSTTYRVVGLFNMKTTNANDDPAVKFGSPGTGSTISLFFTVTTSSATSSVNLADFDPTHAHLDNESTNFEKYLISGTITTGTTTAAADLEFHKNTGSPTITIGAGSYLMFIPN